MNPNVPDLEMMQKQMDANRLRQALQAAEAEATAAEAALQTKKNELDEKEAAVSRALDAEEKKAAEKARDEAKAAHEAANIALEQAKEKAKASNAAHEKFLEENKKWFENNKSSSSTQGPKVDPKIPQVDLSKLKDLYKKIETETDPVKLLELKKAFFEQVKENLREAINALGNHPSETIKSSIAYQYVTKRLNVLDAYVPQSDSPNDLAVFDSLISNNFHVGSCLRDINEIESFNRMLVSNQQFLQALNPKLSSPNSESGKRILDVFNLGGTLRFVAADGIDKNRVGFGENMADLLRFVTRPIFMPFVAIHDSRNMIAKDIQRVTGHSSDIMRGQYRDARVKGAWMNAIYDFNQNHKGRAEGKDGKDKELFWHVGKEVAVKADGSLPDEADWNEIVESLEAYLKRTQGGVRGFDMPTNFKKVLESYWQDHTRDRSGMPPAVGIRPVTGPAGETAAADASKAGIKPASESSVASAPAVSPTRTESEPGSPHSP